MPDSNVTILSRPYISTDTYRYDGSVKAVQLINFDSNTMTVSGTQSAQNAGVYSLTISLKNPDSYTWDDNTTESLILTWSIEKAVVSIPKLTSVNFTFDGETHSPEISGYDSQIMSVSGDTAANEVGNYQITYALKDPDSYAWEDGTVENKIIHWSIKTRTNGKKVVSIDQLYIVRAYIDDKDAASIKSGGYADNKICLYTTADKSGTAAVEINLPEEMLLDQMKTTFVRSFTWSETAYPGSTNPNLDGKPVLVLAVKGNAAVNYSFVSLESLIKAYTSGTTNSADVTVDNDGTIKANVKVSAVEGNAVTVNDDGIFVPAVDVNNSLVYAADEEVKRIFNIVT